MATNVVEHKNKQDGMRESRREIMLSIGSKKLPSELRIFSRGVNTSTKGPIIFDEDAARDVLNAYSSHGVERLPFDYEHAQLDPAAPIDDQISAGSFRLELREGELWAIDIRWTPRAAREIRDGERMYLSPAFLLDEESGRVVRLINVALTSLPALDGATPLMAAKAVPFAAYPSVDYGGWDGTAAEARIRSWADGDWQKYMRAFAWYDENNSETYGAYKLPHHDVVDGELVTPRSAIMAAAGALSGARGGVDIPDADVGAVRDHIAGHYRDMDMEAPWEREEMRDASASEKEDKRKKERCSMSTHEIEDIAQALCLGEGADLAGAVARAKELSAGSESIMQMTQTKSMQEAHGVLLGWRASHERLATAEQELAELRGKIDADRRALLLKEHARKFTPESLAGWVKAATTELLEQYVRTAPNIVTAPEDAPKQPAVETVALSEYQKRMARWAGLSDAEYAAARFSIDKQETD